MTAVKILAVALAATAALVAAGCATPGLRLEKPEGAPLRVWPACQGRIVAVDYDRNGDPDDGGELRFYLDAADGRVLAVMEYAPGETGGILRARVGDRLIEGEAAVRAAYPSACDFLPKETV